MGPNTIGDLPSMLEAPLQHLPRYKKALEILLKTTFRTNVDYDSLMTAYTRVKSTTDQVEESVKVRRNSENMERIRKILTGNYPADLTTDKNRMFIREGTLTIERKGATKKKFFILFSDCLIWGEKDESGKVKYRKSVSFAGNCSIRDLPKSKIEGLEYGIELITQTR